MFLIGHQRHLKGARRGLDITANAASGSPYHPVVVVIGAQHMVDDNRRRRRSRRAGRLIHSTVVRIVVAVVIVIIVGMVLVATRLAGVWIHVVVDVLLYLRLGGKASATIRHGAAERTIALW